MGAVPAYAEDVDIARLGAESPAEVDEIPEAPDVPTPLIDPNGESGDGAGEPVVASEPPVGTSAAPNRPPKSQRKKRPRNRRHGRNR
jgi:hypothetical protein